MKAFEFYIDRLGENKLNLQSYEHVVQENTLTISNCLYRTRGIYADKIKRRIKLVFIFENARMKQH